MSVAAGYSLFFLSLIIQWVRFEQYEKIVVMLLALYMMWWELRRQEELALKPAFASGTLIVALGVAMMTVGRVSETFLLQEVSLGVALIGLTLAIFGYRIIGVMLWPLAYLILLTGLLQVVLIHYSEHMQNVTAYIASLILKGAGLSVHRNGRFLEMPHIHLEVARICSGLYSVISFYTLAFPFAFITQRDARRRLLLLLLAGSIAMFSNGLRVAVIGLWTHANPGAEIHGIFNDSVASVLFGLLFIVFCGILLKKSKDKRPRSSPYEVLRSLTKNLAEMKLNVSRRLGVLLSILLIGFAFSIAYKPMPMALEESLDGIPMSIGKWTGEANPEGPEFYEVQSPDMVLRRTYTDTETERRVHLYIAYFAIQGEGRKLVKQPLDLFQGRSEVICVGSNPSRKDCITRTIRDTRHIYYHWYIVDGVAYADRNAAKLTILLNSVMKRRNNGALAVVSADRTEDQDVDNADRAEIEFLNQLMPALLGYFSDVSVKDCAHAATDSG